MPPSLALATAAGARGEDPDEPLLLDAIARLGVQVVTADWNDSSVAWEAFDLVVLRSTWDYVERLEDFQRWLTRVAAVTTLANPAPMVAWSLDKHYLAHLAAAGVAVVPTTFLEPGESFQAPDPSTSHEYVVKPAIGAGSRDAARYRAGVDDDVAARHANRLLGGGRSVLVQPYLAHVDRVGETPMVYLDGRFSHAARKKVLLPRARALVGGLFAPEDNEPAVATDTQHDVARAAMAAIPSELGHPLYARVDLVFDDDGLPRVLELELAEPSLFLPENPGAALRVAEALVAAGRAAAVSRSRENGVG